MRIDQLPNTKWSRVTDGDERIVHYVVRDVRPKLRRVTLVAVLDGSEEPKRYRPRSCRSHETHGDAFRTGIVGECGYS
jgi:hypothetical protein